MNGLSMNEPVEAQFSKDGSRVVCPTCGAALGWPELKAGQPVIRLPKGFEKKPDGRWGITRRNPARKHNRNAASLKNERAGGVVNGIKVIGDTVSLRRRHWDDLESDTWLEADDLKKGAVIACPTCYPRTKRCAILRHIMANHDARKN